MANAVCVVYASAIVMANAFLKSVFICALLIAAGTLASAAAERATLSLAGQWQVRLDPRDQGLQAGWPTRPMASTNEISLPNTTDKAELGIALDTNTMRYSVSFPVTTRFPGVKEPSQADEHGYLVRRHLFVGPVWYEREIEIPASWKSLGVTFRIERTMWKTDAWLDGISVGACDSLVAEHRYFLGVLAPGRHRLTVRVDNRMIHNLSTVTHAYGPETQSRWNGMIGSISLEAANMVSLQSVDVFPAADRASLRAVIKLTNGSAGKIEGVLRPRMLREKDANVLAESAAEVSLATGDSSHELMIHLKQPAEVWDEFQPIRYRLQVAIESKITGERLDTTTTTFGFRHLERADKELRLNGRRLFLRGTLDCCVYPKTGHPPMSVAEWERILGTIKEHGFNHVRYHTWCPPDAAFEAADRLGLYLQPEAPAWVDDWGVNTITHPQGIGRDPEVWEYLKNEVRRIAQAYGNHPSFLMFTIGNEFGESQTDWTIVNDLVQEMKRRTTTTVQRLHCPATSGRR
jgi:beta-galactosidase/beta-glucuronidase